jgi:hypothetical protein
VRHNQSCPRNAAGIQAETWATRIRTLTATLTSEVPKQRPTRLRSELFSNLNPTRYAIRSSDWLLQSDSQVQH